MSIKRKIWALPVISTIIFGLGLAGSSYLATAALDSIRTTESVDYPVLDSAKSLTLDVGAVADALRDAVTEGDKNRVSLVGEQANKLRAKLAKFGEIPGQRDNAARLSKEFDIYYAPALSAARIMLELEQGDPQATVGRMQGALTVLNADLAKTNEAAQMQFKAGIATSEARVRNVLTTSIVVALIVILSLALVSYFVVQAIWQQLGGEPEYAREIARAVADGDLSMDIMTDPKDSASLLVALKEMRGKLGNMVSEIKISAETIKVASSEIAHGNADLASRTESQAGSLDQTARSMESLTTTVRQNASNATEANELVVSASSVAIKGGKVVSQVVLTMGEINDSAKKIVDIIGVIDGIAFQTNILALNAAVEAARAGEQGRGFAVVASEVRNLAQRSAGAAKEIKELIGDSVSKVNIGSKLVDEAGLTMGQIVASVKKVADIMAEISAASQAQSTGIENIGQAIGSMDEMTQQNSALVEQAAAAAESLQDQADQLSTALAVFKLAPAARQRPGHLALGRS
ncbi:methyl-accepting chemotaxis protein [Oxalobacteraceae bacterium GrIS 1.11]